MDDVAVRHERLRTAYLDARDALVDVLIERIGAAVRDDYPGAQCLAVDADHLQDGRLLLRPTGVGVHTDGTGPGALAQSNQKTAPALQRLLSELGELVALEEVPEYIVLP